MNIPSPRSGRKARIEIIPLIDIIFFLLSTFVMVSLSMIKNQGVQVNLPVAATSAAQDRKESSVITVTESGGLYLDKELLAQEQIIERLKVLKSTDPDLRVFINGDQKAEFGTAVSVLDEIRKLGISKVAIETKTK